MKPLVSVLCPTYNHAPFIEQAIKGFLEQETNFPIEILIGEDGSSDGTSEICQDYANENAHIYILSGLRSEVHCIEGVPTGRNNIKRLFKRARGKYIALCEGDDYWTDPQKLQRQVDFLENNRAFSCVFHNAHIVEGGQQTTRLFLEDKPEMVQTVEDSLNLFRPFAPTCSLLFRSYPIKTLLPPWSENSLLGDRVYFTMLANQGLLRFQDFCGGVRRMHAGGLTARFRPNKRRETIKFYRGVRQSVLGCSELCDAFLAFHEKQAFKKCV